MREGDQGCCEQAECGDTISSHARGFKGWRFKSVVIPSVHMQESSRAGGLGVWWYHQAACNRVQGLEVQERVGGGGGGHEARVRGC